MKDEERLEMLNKLVYKLIEKSESGVPIFVEGMKDEISLRRIGVKGRILKVKACRTTLADIILTYNMEKEVVVLTDFDREGEELAETLTSQLTSLKVKADTEIRMRVRAAVKGELRSIEELAEYIEKLKASVNTTPIPVE